ncbi:MAG: hypothetical protein QNK33_10035 [Bacteroidales bacterium]|nr:hypothetical protein [Bacteroidales bacterium]
MKRLLILFLLINSVQISAQVSTVYVSGQSMSEHFRMHPSSENVDTKILGSPYADEHWTTGTISFKNISQIVSDHLRLNASTNELEVFNKGKKMAVIEPFNVKEVKVGDREYIYAFYIYEYGKSFYISSSYFHVICKGKIELLKRYYVRIVNNTYVSNYMGGGGDGRMHYSVKSEYFYRTNGDEAARELGGKKKDILKLMADCKDKIEEFIKENKINVNNDEDVEEIINYYNSLCIESQ